MKKEESMGKIAKLIKKIKIAPHPLLQKHPLMKKWKK
jgi:hypothetical protein